MSQTEEDNPLLASTSQHDVDPWVAPGDFFNGTHYLYRHGSNNNDDSSSNNKSNNEIVVFVHGISSYHSTFNRIANILLNKGGYSVLQFDLMGRGFSQPSRNGKYGRTEHIQQMYQLLNHLQLLRHHDDHDRQVVDDDRKRQQQHKAAKKTLHIIGHSMGGCLSTLFSSEYPEYVRSLTLIAPAGLLGYFPIEFTKQLCPCILGVMKARFAKRSNAMKSWKGDFYSHEGESLMILNERIRELSRGLDNNPHAFEAFWHTLMEFPLTNISQDIAKLASYTDLPIMIIWGKQDKSCPFDNLHKWERLIRKYRNNNNNGKSSRADGFDDNLHLKPYDKAAHGIANEHYKTVSYDILTFLNQYSR